MSKVEQIRKEFVEQLFNEVCNVPSYSNLYSNNFNVIAKLGLQLKAKEERLFENGDQYQTMPSIVWSKIFEII